MSAILSCNLNNHSTWQNIMVLYSPIYAMPVYIIALYLLKNYSESQNNYIRCAQFMAVIMNFLELFDMTTLFYPQFIIPILGIQAGGVLQDYYYRVMTFIIIALILHHGINTTTLFIVHYRLVLLKKSIVVRQKSINFLMRKCHIFATITYFLMMISVMAICLCFRVDRPEYQQKWKSEYYDMYQIEEIFCPKYQVLNPHTWEFTVMMCISCTVTAIFAVVFVLCSLVTISVVQSAKATMSRQSVKYHMHVVVTFFISCGIQALFVVAPVLHMLLCVYFEIFKVYTGDYIFYSLLIQAHQGTAFTSFYVISHRNFRKFLKKCRSKLRRPTTALFKRSS